MSYIRQVFFRIKINDLDNVFLNMKIDFLH